MKPKKTTPIEKKILNFCKLNKIDIKTLQAWTTAILQEQKLKEIQTAAIPITCTSKKALAKYIKQIKSFSSKRFSDTFSQKRADNFDTLLKRHHQPLSLSFQIHIENLILDQPDDLPKKQDDSSGIAIP
jgi:hypothetical protein